VKNPTPGPSYGNYVCAYTEPGPGPGPGSTKYVDIPGGCYIDHPAPGIDSNSKCLGLGSLSCIQCYTAKKGTNGKVDYKKAKCDKTTTVSDGTQCSVECTGKYTPSSPGPQPPPLLCPTKDGDTGDTCSTLTLNGNSTPFCLNDADAREYNTRIDNPPNIKPLGTNAPEIAACSQYYEVNMVKINKDGGYCLLYNVDGITPGTTPFTPENVVKPVEHMDKNFYCPVSYTKDNKVYNIVPLNLDEDTGSGEAPVFLTQLGYSGYGTGSDGYMSTTSPGPITYGGDDRRATRTPFKFGPNEHVKTDGAGNITPPILMSTKSVIFAEEPQPKPRLIDCLNVFDEPGLNNINLDGKSRQCTAHFDCSKHLGKKSDLYNKLDPYKLIPYDTGEDKWAGGYCAEGESAGKPYSFIYGPNGSEVLSTFSWCTTTDIDVKEVPGVY